MLIVYISFHLVLITLQRSVIPIEPRRQQTQKGCPQRGANECQSPAPRWASLTQKPGPLPCSLHSLPTGNLANPHPEARARLPRRCVSRVGLERSADQPVSATATPGSSQTFQKTRERHILEPPAPWQREGRGKKGLFVVGVAPGT